MASYSHGAFVAYNPAAESMPIAAVLETTKEKQETIMRSRIKSAAALIAVLGILAATPASAFFGFMDDFFGDDRDDYWYDRYGYGGPYGYGSPYGWGGPYGYGGPYGWGGGPYGYGHGPYGWGTPYGYGAPYAQQAPTQTETPPPVPE